LDTLPEGKKSAPISVITNGVDLEYFHPNSKVERELNTLIFSGKMSYHANITMVKYLCDEIMPRLLKKRPDVRLVLVGKDPPAEVRRLANSSYVEVTGTVDDIRPFLWKATVAVVPLIYGAGVQNKLLEAMATGTAVITTSKVLNTLSVVSGKDLLVGDSPEEFTNCVLELLQNVTLRNAIGEAGSQYVRTNHDWAEKAQRLTEIYSQLEPAN
jgi:polysaccharide biosynthesis protein PslH